MAESRVSQAAVEVLSDQQSQGRISQEPVEVLITRPPTASAGLSQLAVEVLIQNSKTTEFTANTRITTSGISSQMYDVRAIGEPSSFIPMIIQY